MSTAITDFRIVSHSDIRANPDQPRKGITAEELLDLSDSIRKDGILQPLLVRLKPSRFDGTPFILIGGERRWRASEGILEQVPVIVKDVDDIEAERLALIDNIHRSDLKPIDEGRAIRAMMEQNGWDIPRVQQEISMRRRTVEGEGGISQGWVNNRLNLTKTGKDIQAAAAERPDGMSALLLVDRVKEPELRADLIVDVVEREASFRSVKPRVDAYLHKVEEEARASRLSTPDAHTQERQRAHARGDNSTMSRGKRVIGPTRDSINQEAERALTSLVAYGLKMTDADFETNIVPTLRNLLRGDMRREMKAKIAGSDE